MERGFIEAHYIAWQFDSLGNVPLTRMDNIHGRSLRGSHRSNRRIASGRPEERDQYNGR
jgi:hypothetical protein